MTSGRMSPKVLLTLALVLGFCMLAFGADEKPVYIDKIVSPNVTQPEHTESTVPLVDEPGTEPEDQQEQEEAARVDQQIADQQAAEESAKQQLLDELSSGAENGPVLGEPITTHEEVATPAYAVDPTQEEIDAHEAASAIRDYTLNRSGEKALNAGHPTISRDPSTVFLSEGFGDTIGWPFPPAGWDTINTDAGYGWFQGQWSGGGTPCALVTYHLYGPQQDEWLLTPDVDVSTATSDLKLEFWSFQGYEYPHDFFVHLSTDGGTTWTQIYDSYGTGYPDFEWYLISVDLSAYAGTGNIMIGFQYYAVDADLFGIDDVSINDDAASVGRCCYDDAGTPACDDILLADCNALGGDWDGALNCTDDPCPVAPANDDCANAEAIGDVTDHPWSTTLATHDGPGDHYITSNNIWYCYTATCTGEVTVSLCGSSFDTKLVVYDGCTCDPIGAEVAYNDDGCSGYGSGSDYASEASFMATSGDQFLIQVAGYSSNSGDGLLTIYCSDMSEGACCFADGSCDAPLTEEDCTTAGGDSWIAGGTCDPNLCPQPAQPGDNCTDPLMVTLPAALPYLDNNTTCGRVDDYENTCLGSYDTGEDIVYELTVTEPIIVNITLDPLGTTWSGIMISADCPDDDAACIDYSTTSGSSAHGITDLALDAGTYYIMIDTWSTPDCIDEFNLTIEAGTEPIGRCCYGDPVECDDITEAACDGLGGVWAADLNCTDNPCPEGGNNDFCEEAVEVNGPFPVVVEGTTVGATIDCPGDEGIGDWAAVWYKIELPYASNNVSVDYCNTPEEIYSVSATLFTECSCDEGVRVYYSWGEFYNCGDAYDVPRLGWDQIPGPGYIWYAVALDAPAKSEMDFHFTLGVEEYVIPTGRCCYGDPGAPDCTDGITEADCDALAGSWVEGLNCVDNPCPVIMGDNCSDAVAIGPADVVDLEFTTDGATNDGAGYTTGPNIWFCYEAPYTGICTASLCGSSYDTKMAGYDGCVCDPLGTLLASNDDADCVAKSLQSEIEFPVVAGQLYLIEVGGYSSAAGAGVLNVSTVEITTSACCDPLTGDCTMLTEDDCIAAGGNWHFGEDCATYTCPPPASPGDNCEDPITDIKFPADLPWQDLNQYTCGRWNNYEGEQFCYNDYYGDGEDIVYELDIDETVTIQITIDPKGTTWTYCQIGTSCPPVADECDYYFRSTGGVAYTSEAITLAPGMYYMFVDTWPSPDCIPDFDIFIETVEPPIGRCCYGEPTAPDCIDTTEAVCMDLAGSWDADMNCTDNPCVPVTEGNDCTDPYLVKLPDDLPFINLNYTCDRGNNYDATCMGSYDGGEDIIYELDVDGTIILDITLDPHGTTYTGIMVSADCPDDDGTCIAYSTMSGSSVHGIDDLELTTGLYYIMIDTWPSPACIPEFELTIVESGQLPGRCCFGDALAPSCADETDGECYARPDWLSFDAGLNCTDNPCQAAPDNDNCSDVTPITLADGVSTTVTGDNTNATSDCGDLAPATEAWEAFTIDTAMNVTIDYCGTVPEFELVYIVLYTDCPCDAEGKIFATSTDWDACGDGNITMFFEGLPAGTYYLPVLASHPDYPPESYYYEGPYSVTFLGEAIVPDYCSASGGCDEFIENVTVAEINNSSACDGYADYTGQIANMQFGASFPISITIGNAYSSDYGGVWIDWNQDLDFDDAGEAIALDVSSGVGPYTGTIVVPGTATAGLTRMRVRVSYSSAPGPCGVTSYGEAEDYSINVGGEQSTLVLDPTAIDFGVVEAEAAGGTTLNMSADGEATIMFSFDYEYAAKASIGVGQCDPLLKASPFQGAGHVPAADKNDKSIFFEGFETTMPPTGWTLESFNAITWDLATYLPYEGTQYATCTYDSFYTDDQDEWLISPVIDLSGGTYGLDFWWNGSYYWSVDPYDNCDLEVWVSIDGGATWLVQLWGEDDYGEFVNWEWNNTFLDLSAFAGESNVKIAFRYTGYDGAQLSVDAVDIYEFTPPLNWLSAAPATGTIPANGAVDVTVAYNMAGLEEGVYNANLVITHTGASKATATVPVTIEVGTVALPDMDPDPIYALYYFFSEPMNCKAYVENDDLPTGYTTASINLGTLTLNGFTPLGTVLNGDVLEISFHVHDLIDTWPLMWDEEMRAYVIAGQFGDATPFSLDYEVMTVGHTSGDANLDGFTNVGDAVYLINYVFKEGAAPRVMQTGDANCDGLVNVADPVRLVGFVFRNGISPCHVDE